MKKKNISQSIKLNNMATHDFSKSLNYEHSNFPKADKFYTEKLKAGKITDDITNTLEQVAKDLTLKFRS